MDGALYKKDYFDRKFSGEKSGSYRDFTKACAGYSLSYSAINLRRWLQARAGISFRNIVDLYFNIQSQFCLKPFNPLSKWILIKPDVDIFR
jgi:hypothetical protein